MEIFCYGPYSVKVEDDFRNNVKFRIFFERPEYEGGFF